MNTTEPTVYWPNRRSLVIALLAGITLFGLGAALLTDITRVTTEDGQVIDKADGRAHLITWALIVVGGWLAVMTCASLTGRVVVHGQGVTTSYRFLRRGFSFSWDAVESWSVQVRDPDAKPYRVAWFTVRDARWPIAVWEDEARWPSFDQFLQDLRAHIGAKEQEFVANWQELSRYYFRRRK